ncbi:MAG: universal stress protein [Winogradskyella sp.]|uniref:universal stress protein n=1 Tax=Winogradskyella sp. TaxID=1883156 RepID=UPI00385EEE80
MKQNNKYKILVLSDLKEPTKNALKNAVQLAKTIDANVEFFHVKKPTDIVSTDSQLSAMRSINKEYVITEKKIEKLVAPIIEGEAIAIDTSFVFGNVKNEIKNHINNVQPDVIILGSRKPKVLSFIGDKITEFVSKYHKKTTIIVSTGKHFDFETLFSLDVLKQEHQVIEA